MSDKAQTGWPSEFVIVGSTIIPRLDSVPRRLSPIYARRGDRTFCYVPYGEEGPQGPDLMQEPWTWLEESEANGEVVRFEPPLAAQADHWLLQVRLPAPPEYLPAAVVPARLREARHKALGEAAEALASERRHEAEGRLWYAARAEAEDTPNDPLPLLLLIALCRQHLPAEQLRVLEQDAAGFSAEARALAKADLARKEMLRPLYELLDKDLDATSSASANRPYPAYLDKVKAKSNFSLRIGRQLWGPTYGPAYGTL